MLKSRNHHNPAGFHFHQAETGWTSPKHIGFDATVTEVIKHRKANPRFGLPIDRAKVEYEVEAQVIGRLKSIRGGEAYLVDASAPPMSFPKPQRSVVGGVVAAAKRAVAGISLLKDWLGDDLKPVDLVYAEKRAQICITCPQNQEPNTLQAGYAMAANAVHLLMQSKNEMTLSTKFDAQLKTCKACECSLPLKVWVPISHVKKHTSEETKARLDPRCWVLKE